MEVHAHPWSTILANLEIAKATSIDSGALTKTVRVKPEVRKRLLAGVHWQELQNIGRRKVFAVKCGLSHGKEKNSDLIRHKEAYSPFLWPDEPLHIECGQATIPDHDSNKVYCVTTGKKPSDVSYCSLQLPSFNNTAKGTEFVIKNQSKSFIECCSRERRYPIPACSQWLGAGEAIILHRAEKKWECLGRAGGHRSDRVATNPLLRESGSVVDCNQGVINYENDGEYFLTRPIIEHTLSKKLAKQAGTFRYHYCTSPDELGAAIKTTEKSPCYFVYENTENNHVTAGCVQVSGDDVQCYLHETLGAESRYTEPLVKTIRKEIETAFPGKRAGILLPEEGLQIDYVSCGVMAIKGIGYFARHPERLEALFKQEKVNDDNHLFDTVKVRSLPAGIVKLCQDRSLIYSHPDQQDNVNSKETLREYLSLFDAIAVKEVSGIKTRVNAAAYIKRYKYLMDYIKDHTVSRATADTIVQLPELGNSRKRRIATLSGPLKKRQVLDKAEIEKPAPCPEEHLSFAFLHDHDYCALHPLFQSQTSRDSSGYGSS